MSSEWLQASLLAFIGMEKWISFLAFIFICTSIRTLNVLGSCLDLGMQG